MTLRFACPACDVPDRFDLPGPPSWHCPACGHAVDRPAGAVGPTAGSRAVALCGNGELYRRKDFPQWLGMLILTGACVSFFVLAVVFFQYTLAWAILLGSAPFDGLLYGTSATWSCATAAAASTAASEPRLRPVRAATAENYRQERLREQLQVEKKS